MLIHGVLRLAPPTCLAGSMEGRTVAYVILFYKGSEQIGEVPSKAPQSRTIEVAQSHMEAQGADFAKIVHDDTGVVVWEGTREA